MMNDTQLPTLSGMVTHGQAIGRTYGMPTANLPIPADTPLPPCGVYASRVCWQGQEFAGLTHIGAAHGGARRAGGDRNAPAGF